MPTAQELKKSLPAAQILSLWPYHVAQCLQPWAVLLTLLEPRPEAGQDPAPAPLPPTAAHHVPLTSSSPQYLPETKLGLTDLHVNLLILLLAIFSHNPLGKKGGLLISFLYILFVFPTPTSLA